MPTPSIAQVATTYNWLSSMDATTAILRPDIDPSLTRRYGNQDMTGLMEEMSAIVPAEQIIYTHFEDDWLHEIVSVGVQGPNANNVTVSLTLTASYQITYPSTAQAPYIVTGAVTTNPLLENQIIQFPSGVQAYVTNISYSAGTFDATPVVTGTAIPTTATTDQIIIIGNAHPEASGQPGSRSGRTNRYVNNLQIFKWDNGQSGTSMGSRLWFQVEGKNGMGWYWQFKGQMDEFMRAKNEREISMLVQKKTTNTTFANISGQSTTVTTEGLIPWIENFGNTANYSLVPGITLSDFGTMIKSQLDKNRGAKENSLWVGINLSDGIEGFMRDTMKNGAISYGMFQGNKQKYIDFGFDSFTYLGYTFHKKVYDPFNYSKMLGATGQPYVNMGLVIPMENTVASLGPNKTKVSVPPMRMKYLSGATEQGSVYKRDWEEWYTGAAAGVYTETTDRVQYHMRSHWGTEFFAPNRFVKIINS